MGNRIPLTFLKHSSIGKPRFLKFQIPITQSQIISKYQIQMAKRFSFGFLGVGHWNLSGI